MVHSYGEEAIFELEYKGMEYKGMEYQGILVFT